MNEIIKHSDKSKVSESLKDENLLESLGNDFFKEII